VTKVPDVPICVELNINRAGCVRIISGQTFPIDDEHKLDGKTWWDMRDQMILVPADSWVEIKKFIIDICKRTNQCQKEVRTWERSVDVIDKQIKSKLP
jgi:hypothetical protein